MFKGHKILTHVSKKKIKELNKKETKFRMKKHSRTVPNQSNYAVSYTHLDVYKRQILYINGV